MTKQELADYVHGLNNQIDPNLITIQKLRDEIEKLKQGLRDAKDALEKIHPIAQNPRNAVDFNDWRTALEIIEEKALTTINQINQVIGEE